MFALPLRRTSQAARVVAVRRSVSISAPNYAEAEATALKENILAPVLGKSKATATKPSTSSLSPVQANPKAPAATSGRRKPASFRKRAPSTTAPVDPATTVNTKRRPQISTDRPKKWNRPIAEGVLPAYDEALKLIMRDSEDLSQKAQMLAKEIGVMEAQVEAEEAQGNVEKVQSILEELESLRQKYHIISVQSQVNLPSTRWTVANAQLDPWNHAHLHLAEQRWRGQGALDLLMERLHQMYVVPDLLPGIHPSLDLHVTVPYPLNKQFKRSMKSGGKSIVGVEPGSFLSPTQTARAPGLWAHAWHSDVRLYTMVMLDPDRPDEKTRSFTTYLHWMKPNIPISAVTQPRAFIPSPLLNSHTKYVPPHPQHGTMYHRYTILLLPQPPKTVYSLNTEAKISKDLTKHNTECETTTSKWLDIPVVPDSKRRGFDLRQFVKTWELSGSGLSTQKNSAVVVGGGAHMFREVWDETVSGVFETAVAEGREKEERYALPKKVDRYEGLKGVRKYI
ncbi:phosphatidylethanolamine-binding protein [Lentinula aciculospora]|uniref:Phosphatidylethanolamine-binding protein n=1 Tax=Lentinula aciculospora TaxID=153920 RepID=A0A9W9DV01_9AGAR|nr:phosphatidylethanolamine-binding protein [Lentinula aciculospora]